MAQKALKKQLSGATSAAATTTVIGPTVAGFEMCEQWSCDVQIVGPTGGPVDVYLQRLVSDLGQVDVWADWVHFPQVAAGTTKAYNCSSNEATAVPVLVGIGSDASAGVGAAADTMASGPIGRALRLVTVTGAGVTVAGSVACYFNGHGP